MSKPPRDAIEFILNGQPYELTREVVNSHLADVPPDRVSKHAVRINDVWFPVIQAFAIATGIPRSDFISHTARRHLAALGYEVHSEIDSRTTPRIGASAAPAVGPARAPRPGHVADDEEWHTEANAQAAVVTNLAGRGWRILSVANTATKERGIDVIAVLDGCTAGVEVKGFPSRNYADPSRSSETKRTPPARRPGIGMHKQCSPLCACAARNRSGGASSRSRTFPDTAIFTSRPAGPSLGRKLKCGGSGQTEA